MEKINAKKLSIVVVLVFSSLAYPLTPIGMHQVHANSASQLATTQQVQLQIENRKVVNEQGGTLGDYGTIVGYGKDVNGKQIELTAFHLDFDSSEYDTYGWIPGTYRIPISLNRMINGITYIAEDVITVEILPYAVEGEYGYPVGVVGDSEDAKYQNVVGRVAPGLSVKVSTLAKTNKDVTITATASGKNGIKQIKLPNGKYVNGAKATYEVSENGHYMFVAEDNAGNKITRIINIVNIDRLAPSFGLEADTTAKTNKDVTIFTVAVDDSEVKRIKLPNGKYVNDFRASYKVSKNGTYTFEVEDVAGNKATESIKVTNIDKTAPTATLKASTTSKTKGDVTITAAGSDNVGVKRIKLPNGKYVTGAKTTYKVTANGTYNFVIEDTAGNTVTKSIKVANIDKTAPTVTLKASTTAKIKGDVTITVTASDANGVKRIKLPNGKYVNGAKTTYKVTKNGTYTFVVEDSLGNAKTQKITVSNIDKSGPTVTLKANTTAKTNKNVTITVTASDGSGVKRIKLPNGKYVNAAKETYTVTKNGTYKFEVEDKLGNKTTKSITVSNIDKTAPKKPTVNNVTTKSTTVTGKAEANATVYVYVGSKKLGSVKANAKGNYSVKIAKQRKNTNLKVYVQDAAGNKSGTVTKKVK